MPWPMVQVFDFNMFLVKTLLQELEEIHLSMVVVVFYIIAF